MEEYLPPCVLVSTRSYNKEEIFLKFKSERWLASPLRTRRDLLGIPTEAKLFCLLSHTDPLDTIRDHVRLKNKKGWSILSNTYFQHAIVFTRRA